MISICWKRKVKSQSAKSMPSMLKLKSLYQHSIITSLKKARLARSLNPINVVEILKSSERRFHNLLQKLVDCRQITSSLADKARQEFRKFKSNIFRKNEAIFWNFNIDKNRLDEFYVENLKDSTQYESFCYVVEIALTEFHGQADVERGFSEKKS